MEGQGTVAIVRGLPGAALTVTLVDSGRQYTLLPESFTHPTSKTRAQACHTTGSQCISDVSRRESGVQATDGRYASTYKMMHCHCSPTSPTQHVTEFPPQKAEVCPGHDNFEVGGAGSGESVFHPTRCTGYRGGMIWPDRGSVCCPRPSLQPDSFATSLRRYPNLTPDRSSEIVERLINFTQTKNSSKYKGNCSPTRNVNSDLSANSSRSAKSRGEAELHINTKRLEESPTRERTRNVSPEQEIESWKKSTFSKTNDVRYLKNVTRKVREGIRSLSAQSKDGPERLNPGARCDVSTQRTTQWSTNTVNMEIQAAVQMISREIITLPRVVPSQRTIAVPLSPTPSNVEDRPVDDIFNLLKQKPDLTQFVEANLVPTDIMVQTVISNTVISNHNKHKRRYKRRSKSEEEIKRLSNLKAITNLYDASCSKARSYHKHKYNRSIKALLKIANNFEIYSNSEEERSVSRISRTCYAHIAKHKHLDDNSLVELLEDWIKLIPLKISNHSDKQIAKEYIFYDFYTIIKESSFLKYPFEEKDKLITNIIKRLELFPLEIKGNKKIMLRSLADVLINKIIYSSHSRCNNYKNIKRDDYQSIYTSILKRFIVPPDNEVNKFVSKEMKSIKATSGLLIKDKQIKEVEKDLVDIITSYMDEIRCGYDNHVINHIAEILLKCGISEPRAFCYSFIFLRRLKEIFLNNTDRVRSETLVVLPNFHNSYNHRPNANENDHTIKSITDEDIAANLEQYTNELCKQIDEWLSTLGVQIPQMQDTGLKKVIVNDLADDIVDRHKYLELNPDSKVSDESELENLKYQIFKWINKLIGENSLEPMENAPDLMRRIRQIPRPMLLKPDTNIKNESHRQKINDLQKINKSEMDVTNNTFYSIPEYKPNDREELVDTNQSDQPNTTEHLEAEYEQFVKDWVEKIPIEVSNQEEIAIAEKARLGIHNGLWKVVSKLNCDPTTYYNRFLYEDLLDDAISDLLDCLPQTPVLQTTRHALKVQFINKTVDINDRIKETEQTSFKTNLMKSVNDNMRKKGLTENTQDDDIKLHEDQQIIKIVEEYLLSTRFRNDDKIKSEMYKKKLLDEVENFVNDLKKNHPKELKNIDISTYKEEIINVLRKVSLPNENTIIKEADDALLGMEIEQWYSNLPIIPNDDHKVLYQRRRDRDILAKKIKDIQLNSNSESALRNEISRFLEKSPLKEGESLNINYMVDELVSRINNNSKEDRASQISRKVIFQTPNIYEEFKKNVPFHSSIIEATYTENNATSPQGQVTKSCSDITQCNSCEGQRKKYIPESQLENYSINASIKQSRVTIQEPPSYGVFAEERPVSSSFKEVSNEQWLTLQDSQEGPTHKEHIQMQTLPPYLNSESTHFTKNRSQQMIQNSEKYILPSSASSQPTTRGIKTDRGLLEISQVAGPSGYKASYPENILDDPNIFKSARSPDLFRHPDISIQNEYEHDKVPLNLKSITDVSKDSQTTEANVDYQLSNERDSVFPGKVSRGINTTSDGYENESIYASTPRQTISPTIPSVPIKRREKLAAAEKDAVRRRLSFEDSDEDDVPCRCIEKYWKNQQKYKRYSCERFTRYPPFLPFFFPYPYPPY